MNIPIKSIDTTEDFYRMSYFSDISALRNSLQEVGQVQPLWLEVLEDERFRVISGFRRLEAALGLGWQDIEAETISGTPEQRFDWFRKTLFENLSLRSFNWVEKAFVLRKLKNQFHVPEEEILKNWLPTLQIGQNRKWLHWLSAIPNYETEVQEAIATDSLTFDLFEFLSALDGKSRVALVRFFQTLNLGKNRQKEFFALLRDVALRERISMATLLDKKEIKTILQTESSSLGQKTQRLRELFRGWRYPHLFQTEKRFHQIVRDLRLPPVIQLKPPQNFEGDKFRLEFMFRTGKDFAAVVTKLQDVVASGKMNELDRLWEEN